MPKSERLFSQDQAEAFQGRQRRIAEKYPLFWVFCHFSNKP
jgi:hypothetical protein